ncbi:MAG: tryptophan--tRNA ligase, partial [Bacteroidota bacterium]|nr:tryptophan--tRNA ligase [Bacteroidota bacterium]
VMTIPGTDGQKMSKSYGNKVDIFLPEKQLKKVIMSIITDSTPIEEPKDPDTCTVYTLYKLVASPSEAAEMRNKYLEGNYGFGHAKKELLECLLNRFNKERDIFNYLMEHPQELNKKLEEGEEKARKIARTVMAKVRNKLGY